MKQILFIWCFLLLNIGFVFAQNRKNIDSLFQIIHSSKDDSLVIEAYNEMVWQYYGIKNDSALIFAKKGIDYAKGKDLPVSLGNSYRYAGIVYERMADYPKALDMQQKSLSIYEKAKYKPGIANSLMNIGVVYKSSNELPKALEYMYKSLEICEEIDQRQGIAAIRGNLGNIHKQMGEDDKALECYLIAYEIDKEMKNDYGIGVSLVNIGSIYFSKKQYEKAMNYLIESIEVREKIGSVQGLAISYNSLGDVYLAISNAVRAEKCFRESLRLSKEAGAMESEKDANFGLYTISKMKQDPKNALSYYEEYVRLKDSIYNADKNEELNSLKTQFELEKLENKYKEDQRKKDEENRIQNATEKARIEEKAASAHNRDMLIIYAAIAVLIVVVIFSFILYSRFKVTSRQNKIIETQKSIVEEKNKQITDSINYAQRIQSALLPSELDLKKYYPESFIFFQPKDIVSGDFVWLHGTKDFLFFAVADCTGHGVPGGFMSMLGTSFLNEIVIEKQIQRPSEILNLLREKVILALKQREDEIGAKDGMDIVFIRFDLKQNKITYASANNGFYTVQKGNLVEHKPDKMPIGFYGEMRPFKEENIALQKGDSIFVFSDGYADQFGGPEGKKFKYNQLESLILDVSKFENLERKDKFISAFNNWKKEYEQVDDVCMAGITL